MSSCIQSHWSQALAQYVSAIRKGPFLPVTVGVVGVVILLLNLMTSGHETTGQLALGLILFSITLAIVGLKDNSHRSSTTG